MAAEPQNTWRSRLTGSADRRGIPLGTIVVSVATIILLLDLNAALILVLWVLRTIVVYIIIAFFFTLLMTPATRFLHRHGMSHGGATVLVFLVGVLVLAGLVYLFTEPLVTAAIHFGKQVPDLVSEAKQGRGPLGRLVYRLHLQKYLSEGSSKLTSQLTKVLKPATAFSVGAAAISTVVAILTIAVLTFFTMLEAPRMWRGFLSLFRPHTAQRLERVVDESIRSVTGYMLGNGLTSVIAGVISGATLAILGVPFALLLGVFVALVDLLPLVGGLLAGLPVVVIAAIHSVPAGIVMLDRVSGVPADREPRAQPGHHEQDGPTQPLLGADSRPGGRHARREDCRRTGDFRRGAHRHPGWRSAPGDRSGAPPRPGWLDRARSRLRRSTPSSLWTSDGDDRARFGARSGLLLG